MINIIYLFSIFLFGNFLFIIIIIIIFYKHTISLTTSSAVSVSVLNSNFTESWSVPLNMTCIVKWFLVSSVDNNFTSASGKKNEVSNNCLTLHLFCCLLFIFIIIHKLYINYK